MVMKDTLFFLALLLVGLAVGIARNVRDIARQRRCDRLAEGQKGTNGDGI
jgi:hypothetical protein